MSENPVAPLTSERYINERVKQYQGWYDKKAAQVKSRYLRMRAFSVIGGGLVPVLVNVNYTFVIDGVQVPLVKVIVTVISLLVVIAVSLETVFHYREQWRNYRSTEQVLGHEQFLFLGQVGPYTGLSPESAFAKFVERVEDTIASENAATLNVMTIANDSADGAYKKLGNG